MIALHSHDIYSVIPIIHSDYFAIHDQRGSMVRNCEGFAGSLICNGIYTPAQYPLPFIPVVGYFDRKVKLIGERVFVSTCTRRVILLMGCFGE